MAEANILSGVDMLVHKLYEYHVYLLGSYHLGMNENLPCFSVRQYSECRQSSLYVMPERMRCIIKVAISVKCKEIDLMEPICERQIKTSVDRI